MFNPGASTSQRKKNKSAKAPSIMESSPFIRTRSASRRGKGKITKPKEKTLEPQPGDNANNMEKILYFPREENPEFPPKENFENPREGNAKKNPKAMAEEVVVKKKKKWKSPSSSSTPPMRRSKSLFKKYVEASIPIVNIDSFEPIENEPLNNSSSKELNN